MGKTTKDLVIKIKDLVIKTIISIIFIIFVYIVAKGFIYLKEIILKMLKKTGKGNDKEIRLSKLFKMFNISYDAINILGIYVRVKEYKNYNDFLKKVSDPDVYIGIDKVVSGYGDWGLGATHAVTHPLKIYFDREHNITGYKFEDFYNSDESKEIANRYREYMKRYNKGEQVAYDNYDVNIGIKIVFDLPDDIMQGLIDNLRDGLEYYKERVIKKIGKNIRRAVNEILRNKSLEILFTDELFHNELDIFYSIKWLDLDNIYKEKDRFQEAKRYLDKMLELLRKYNIYEEEKKRYLQIKKGINVLRKVYLLRSDDYNIDILSKVSERMT